MAGRKKSLAIQILDTQHSTWQGSVTFFGQEEPVYFRSALELICLIDSVIKDEKGDLQEKRDQ